MSSIANDPNGRKRILFTDHNGKRKTIRLGKMSLKAVEAINCHVESLLASKISGQPIRKETAVWLTGIGSVLKNKLAANGLIDYQKSIKLEDFLEDYIQNRRHTATKNTINNLDQDKKRLVKYFGKDRYIETITIADAEKWAAELSKSYAPATVGRTIRRARQFFKSALRQKHVNENVFLDVKASGKVNKTRQYHVDRVKIFKVIEAAPNHEWRLIIALSRFAGLRCPSEHLALKWNDIDWARSRLRIDSPKTGERWIPIFPELRPYLEECFDKALEGAVFVITRYRDKSSNLRTSFKRIIRKAGETPWPKLFHNLRASRQTELAAEFPLHVVCNWIGNSAVVANKHYLTVRDEDFERAVTTKTDTPNSGAESGVNVSQKATQQEAEATSNDKQKKTQPHEK